MRSQMGARIRKATLVEDDQAHGGSKGDDDDGDVDRDGDAGDD